MRRRRLLHGAAMAALLAATSAGLVTSDIEVATSGPNNPAPFGYSPTDPRTVLGVHTRLTDEVEYWKIAKTLDMVQAMGAGWIVEFFPWAYIEPHRTVFDWAHPDFLIHEATRRGLSVIARLDFVPAWARPPGTTPRLLPDEHIIDYVNFVQRFAARYRAAVPRFIIWNEPNTSFELGYQTVNPGAYVELLAAAAAAIRAVHPAAKIMPAGLAPTLERSDLALDDVDFLQAMYDQGASKHFDALAVHTYGWKFPPDDPARADRLNFARVELLRDVMVKNGDAAKPIMITESGWNDSPRWTKSVHPGQRIQYTTRALNLVKQDWSWAEALCLWCFRLPAPEHDYNDYFTLVDTSFRPKPIYDALQQNAGIWVR